MLKLTLLEIVQDILNDMDGDFVNSYTDTEESLQVAQIVKTTFAEFNTNNDFAHLRKATTLNSVSEAAHPNYLSLPENTSKLEFLAYNQKLVATDPDRFREVSYLYPDEFLRKVNGRDASSSNILVVTDYNGVQLNIFNNRPPKFWTSFDDTFIVFDGYVADLGSTVVGSESQATIIELPQWTMDDNFIPKLPPELFPGFLAEAKSTAIYKLRQSYDQKAEQQSKRQQRLAAQRGFRSGGGIRYPNYGRSGKGRKISNHLPQNR